MINRRSFLTVLAGAAIAPSIPVPAKATIALSPQEVMDKYLRAAVKEIAERIEDDILMHCCTWGTGYLQSPRMDVYFGVGKLLPPTNPYFTPRPLSSLRLTPFERNFKPSRLPD